MSFPQTRHTLIQRIAGAGDEADWRQFFADYWGPICRFSRRGGSLTADDAEDVAAQTFEALIRNRLLTQWASTRSAKLRTLLCAVVRNVLSNRARVLAGRARLLRDHGGRLDDRGALPLVTSLDAPAEQVDAFYAAWVEDLLQQAVETLCDHYHREGKGDFFRVLYGRLCDAMTTTEIARDLDITVSQAENAFKDARKRLARRLERPRPRTRRALWGPRGRGRTVYRRVGPTRRVPEKPRRPRRGRSPGLRGTPRGAEGEATQRVDAGGVDAGGGMAPSA